MTQKLKNQRPKSFDYILSDENAYEEIFSKRKSIFDHLKIHKTKSNSDLDSLHLKDHEVLGSHQKHKDFKSFFKLKNKKDEYSPNDKRNSGGEFKFNPDYADPKDFIAREQDTAYADPADLNADLCDLYERWKKQNKGKKIEARNYKDVLKEEKECMENKKLTNSNTEKPKKVESNKHFGMKNIKMPHFKHIVEKKSKK